MYYNATEYLKIDLDNELWHCRVCENPLGDARENFKHFTKIYCRNPQEIHRPKLDPKKFEFTFAPDPAICVIYEFYCPHCGTMLDVEYTVPGHLPLHDLLLDIDVLKRQVAEQGVRMPPGEGIDVTPGIRAMGHKH